jgi:hypothetical protein
MPSMAWLPTLVAGALTAIALPLGGRWFGAAVVLLGAVALVELTRLVVAAGTRPVLPAAAVAGLGAPLALTLNPAPKWDAVPGVLAAMVLVAFTLLLTGPRFRHAAAAGGATVLTGLVVALGTSGLLVLRFAGDGFRWTLGLLLLAVVPEVACAVVSRLRPTSAPAHAARVISAGAVVGALVMAAAPPFAVVPALALAATASAAALASAALVAAVPGDRLPANGAGAGQHAAVRWLGTMLFSAPAAAFLALTVQV